MPVAFFPLIIMPTFEVESVKNSHPGDATKVSQKCPQKSNKILMFKRKQQFLYVHKKKRKKNNNKVLSDGFI